MKVDVVFAKEPKGTLWCGTRHQSEARLPERPIKKINDHEKRVGIGVGMSFLLDRGWYHLGSSYLSVIRFF